MATYSPFAVTVDGIRLDSSAWNVSAKTRALAAVRTADVVLPGTDGVSQSLNDDFEATTMTLTMWLVGTDENGIIPSGSNAMAQCRANLDMLMFVFGTRHRLLNVVETVDAVGTTRQAFCKVVDSIAPEIAAGGLGKFVVSLQVGDAMWQDEVLSEWSTTGVQSGVSVEVTTLTGSTGPVSDAIFLVTGPVLNPQIVDLTTGAYVRLNLDLPAGVSWRVNSGTWSTRYGAGILLRSQDTTGTPADAITVFGGGNARFLRLVPAISSNARRVFIYLSGSNFSAATSLGVRARRKFLV